MQKTHKNQQETKKERKKEKRKKESKNKERNGAKEARFCLDRKENTLKVPSKQLRKRTEKKWTYKEGKHPQLRCLQTTKQSQKRCIVKQTAVLFLGRIIEAHS